VTIGIEEITKRAKHHERLSLAGVDGPPRIDLGPLIFLWRRFRDGRETWEILPVMIAELTLEAIPKNEPNVERARLYREMPV